MGAKEIVRCSRIPSGLAAFVGSLRRTPLPESGVLVDFWLDKQKDRDEPVFLFMELRRFELLTPTLPALCSTKLSYNPVRVIQIEKKKFSLSRGRVQNF